MMWGMEGLRKKMANAGVGNKDGGRQASMRCRDSKGIYRRGINGKDREGMTRIEDGAVARASVMKRIWDGR